MTDQHRSSIIESSRRISFDSVTLLSTSTINGLHFPDLTTSGISDAANSRRTSILFDGLGMCESMTESFSSTGIPEDSIINYNSSTHQSDNHAKVERKDSTKKRRSRKALYDASVDNTSFDKIEPFNMFDEKDEPEEAWLLETQTIGGTTDNIYSWVHKEFKTNDINANKHRLLCKLDDMSNARTIRSLSCHNFLDNPRTDSFKRSSTDQQVHSEPVKNGRLSSPLCTRYNENGTIRSTSPIQLSPLSPPKITVTNVNNGTVATQSREVSRERERGPLDYTDLEVMAKVQLQNLRQSERQGPLSKHFGGSNVSLASTSSGTSVCVPNRAGNKPPVAPKPSTVRNTLKPNTYQRSNTQTIVSSSCDAPVITESKPLVTLSTRVSLLPPNSANNNRTRPPVTTRPIQTYRGSQTTYNNGKGQPVAPSSVQRTTKKFSNDINSISTTKQHSSNENGLLNDVSNKPIRSQSGSQRRTVLPQTSTQQTPSSTTTNNQPTLPRSASSSLSQGRKSGIPTVGQPQKPSGTTLTRRTSNKVTPSDNMMATQLTSSWNEGCY